MHTTRREFLKLSAALAVAGWPGDPVLATAPSPTLLSCRVDDAGRHHFTAMSTDGDQRFDIELPARGHGMCIRPDQQECVVFARRPGDFMWVIDLRDGRVLQRIASTEGRHYYGHGVFARQGRLLFVTENAFDERRGVIGVYDAADSYRRLGELPSHGIGPHELKVLSDDTTLVIANGGILTHPDTGRSKLNLPDMDPSLVYVESTSGKLLGQYRPPRKWHRLSIRHLDIGADDQVCVAMQYQGPGSQQPPLIALHSGEENLRLLSAPPEIHARMRNYCGSISCDRSGKLFAVSSPRGNLTTLWSVPDGTYLRHVDSTDGCGLAPGNGSGRFFISNGQGTVSRIGRAGKAASGDAFQWAGSRWDNHMVSNI